MSALGQKRTLERTADMSALPPKADIGQQGQILIRARRYQSGISPQ